MVGFNQDIKVLHLEITTLCNANCPQCSRENSKLYNDAIHRSEITLSQCYDLFSIEFIQGLDKMFMCGDFGDPAAGKDTIEIFRYFRSINPDIVLGMNTNGSIGNKTWWKELASVLSNPFDYVVFSIDGLEDTNHIYRKGVHWNKLILNASTFISAGGSAHWDMLVFKHNEHQVEESKLKAKELGFTFFRSKVSKRFKTTPVNGLEEPVNFTLPNVDNINEVKCHALTDNSIYVSANGKILPCCWIGIYAFNSDEHLNDLLESKNWNKLKTSWKTNPHSICLDTCGISNEKKTSFESQWNKEIQLR